MRVEAYAKRAVQKLISRVIGGEVRRAVQEMIPLLPQLLQYQTGPETERSSYYDHSREPLKNVVYFRELKNKLLELGVPVQEEEIDRDDFESWRKQFPGLGKFYRATGNLLVEKTLEHYLIYKYLRLTPSEVYIDVAADQSPWAFLLNRKGIKSYRLDLIYPPGLHGINIGADAGETKLPEGFASALSLQCAYECFMGDADIKFIKEAARILRPGGRLAIVPLYLDDTYFISVSPFRDQAKTPIDPGAKRVWRDDDYDNFSRHYSPESFQKRIYSILPPDMQGTVLYFNNLEHLGRHYPGQRVYCFFLFYCQKK